MRAKSIVAVLLGVAACARSSTAQPEAPSERDVRVRDAVRRATLVMNADSVRPLLAPTFEFRELSPQVGTGHAETLQTYLANMAPTAADYTDRRLEIHEVVWHRPDSVHVLGDWDALYKGRTQFRMRFTIAIRYTVDGLIDRWGDHFVPRGS